MQKRFVPVISDSNYITSTWFKEVTGAIEHAAARYQWQIDIFTDDMQRMDIAKLPSVVIVTSGSQSYINHVIAMLKKEGKRIILAGLDADPLGLDISCATPSRHQETENILKYLYNCGRRKIALVGFRKDAINDMIRFHTAVGSASSYKLELSNESIYLWETNIEECMARFTSNIRKHNAAICPNDPSAICLMNYCRKNGICIPDDLFIVSFSDMRTARFSNPSLTSIALDFTAIGKQTFNIWHFLHEHTEDNYAIKIRVPSKLIVRASTAYMPDIPHETGSSKIESILDFTDNFYNSCQVRSIIQIENCLSRCDDLDLKILSLLFNGKCYEAIAEELFMSVSSLQYRVKKIYCDAKVDSRSKFEMLIRKNLGSQNPFHSSDC